MILCFTRMHHSTQILRLILLMHHFWKLVFVNKSIVIVCDYCQLEPWLNTNRIYNYTWLVLIGKVKWMKYYLGIGENKDYRIYISLWLVLVSLLFKRAGNVSFEDCIKRRIVCLRFSLKRIIYLFPNIIRRSIYLITVMICNTFVRRRSKSYTYSSKLMTYSGENYLLPSGRRWRLFVLTWIFFQFLSLMAISRYFQRG